MTGIIFYDYKFLDQQANKSFAFFIRLFVPLKKKNVCADIILKIVVILRDKYSFLREKNHLR